MRQIKHKGKKTISDTVFGLFSGFLALIFIFLVIGIILGARPKYYTYESEPRSLLYCIKEYDYHSLLDEVHSNRANGFDEKSNPQYKEPYAVSDYFEAELFYNVYKESDPDRANKLKVIMEESKSKLDSLDYVPDNIDDMMISYFNNLNK